MTARYQNDGERLKALRKLLGLTQREMAREFKVTHGAISQWEAGERSVPGPVVRLIEIYEENLGIVETPVAQDKLNATWASRTLRASLATGKIAARLLGSSIASLVAGNEKAAQIKGATDEMIGAELARALGELKGLSLKIGQMTSYMDFAMPAVIREQLGSLQDSAPPMSAEAVTGVFVNEFGKEPERVFSKWDPKAFAAASIGQVHRASLADGTKLAVKVQYPEITTAIKADLKNTAIIDQLSTALFRYQKKGAVLQELSERLLEECDYEQEARNTNEFRELLAPWPEIVVPRVHPKYSTKKVLALDLIEGETYRQFLARATQEEKNRFGVLLYDSTFTLLFEHHIFNGDANPGNFLFMPDGKVAFVDFGCVKRFDAALMSNWKQLAAAMMQKDQKRVKAQMIKLGFMPRPDAVDFKYLYEFMTALYEPWTEDRVYRITPHYVHETWNKTIGNPDKFKLALPKDLLTTLHLQWGIGAILAELQAEANWHRLYSERVA